MSPDTRLAGTRILLTADAVGGVWTFALDLARGVTAAGARVTLVVLGPAPDDDAADAARRIPGLDLRVPGLPLDWTASSPAAVHAAGEALARLARETGAGLVHLNSPACAAEARFPVPVVGTAHSCVRTWWEAVRGTALPEDFGWRAELVGAGYRALDALTAPTRAFATATAAAYGLARRPVVVPNGVTPPARAERPAGAEVFAFTAGRLWDDGKDVATLDRAAASLPFPAYAAGPMTGPNGATVALPNLRALGRLSAVDLAAWFARRPIFCSAALYEPFGLSVLEAAGHGCPLVLSDIATFRELWDGAALFVPPRDTVALAAALLRLGSDAAERERLGGLAAERAGSYGLAPMVDGMAALYGGLLDAAASDEPRRLAS